MKSDYIYLRGLKHADHTVFCVQDGQKTYIDNLFNRTLPYSSGQQVKRSILEALTDQLNVQMAPITFKHEVNTKGAITNKDPSSPCDPRYIDQLIGGWMKAETSDIKKRRSPLSISALRPLHPLLAGISKENITFDRSDRPDRNPVNVRRAGSDQLLTEEEIEALLTRTGSTLPRRHWITDQARAYGLFVYDLAIDLRRLFSVSLNQHDPELHKEMIEKLKEEGWIESENVFGKCLVLPKALREKAIPALAHAFINWRVTSNQARTFSLMETLALAISDNANTLAAAIRAKLIEESERPKARPIVDEQAGAEVFITLPCANYMLVENESADALEKAEQRLVEMMLAYDYEGNQQ